MNGQEVKGGSWPFIVGLLANTDGTFYNRHICGGSVLSPTRVLTAAHCVHKGDGKTPTEGLQVVVGEHDLTSTDGPERVVNVNCIKMHPKYNHTTEDFDFAILEVDDMELNGIDRSIVCLPELNQHVKAMNGEGQQQCYVAGWGNTGYDKVQEISRDQAEKLISVRLDIFTDEYCRANFKKDFDEIHGVKGWMPADGSAFCAGRQDAEKNACVGDSGGPLVCVVDGVAIQYGIVSHGVGCGTQVDYAGASYGKVAAEIEWISAQVGKFISKD